MVLGLVLSVVVVATSMPVGAAEPGGGERAPAPVSTSAAEVFVITADATGPIAPGEPVDVTITGSRPQATVAIRQCQIGTEACGSSTYVTIGTGGGATVPFVMRRRLPDPVTRHFVDCGRVACELVALQFGTTVEATASTPIGVDGRAPMPRPTLRVVDPGPLAARQTATVEGAGFEPNVAVTFYLCGWDPPSTTIPCADLTTFAFTDSHGGLEVDVPLSRNLGQIDCAVRMGRCQLWAFPSGSIDHVVATRLAFDGTAPLVPPTAAVSPSTNLLHRQSVTVTGAHFAAGDGARIEQCLATPPPEPTAACAPSSWVPIGQDGTISSSLVLTRMMAGQDCVVVACVVRVSGPPADSVDVPLLFDPSVAPPPPPTAAVDPSTGLVDRQVVQLTVTDVDPGAYLAAATCVVGQSVCRGAVSIPVPTSGGAVTGPVTVFRSPATGTDCAVVACEIRVAVYGSSQALLSAPIAFDADLPPSEPPDLRALPGTGLWDRQRVLLVGERFDPGAYVAIWQCAGDPTVAANCTATQLNEVVGGDGRFEARVAVRREISSSSGPADCVVVSCSLVVRMSGTSDVHVEDLSFDPGAPVGATDLPAQLPCVSWPTDGWPVGELPAGVDHGAVEELGDEMIAQGTDSVVVIHGGRLVYERYGDGIGPESVMPSASVSKSFASTMVGLLVDDGLIDIDEPGLFPEWSAPGDLRAGITTRHLLNMSSGLQWTEVYSDPTSDVVQLVQADDAAAFVVGHPAAVAPGTRWAYSTGDSMLLSRVIGDAAGVSGPTYQALLADRLFEPLGIDRVVAGFDAAGRWRAGWWTNTTTRNFAKLGLLYLRHGVWEDQQFLSEAWVDFVRTPAPTSSGYGGQFWLNSDGSFSMVGVGGQSVLIVPRLDLIVAVNNGSGPNAMASLFEGAAVPACDGDAMALVDDDAAVTAGGSVAVDVLANDVGGADGLAPATLTVATDPAHGVAVVESGAIRYQPDDGFAGPDSFRYLVCSGTRRTCLEATVAVTVGPPPG
jgi:CubicO group peptidase (beta-lactamase class C family)